MEKCLAISINPTYKCNLNCDFCYLNKLHSDKLMNLNKLDKQLRQLSNDFELKYIDLYGGEITILDEFYVKELICICEKYTNNISLVSNFVELPEWIYDIKYRIGSSWDYKYRDKGEKILENIDYYYKKTNKKVSVLLCSPKLYDCKEEILNILNRDSIESFALIPCMKTKYNNIEYNFKKYEDSVKYFINHPIKPYFENEMRLKKNREIYKHIFINPSNEIVNIKYDENGNEYFQAIDNIELEIPYKCSICDNFDKCQNEHMENYLEDGYDCIGFYKLINWYNKRQKHESGTI